MTPLTDNPTVSVVIPTHGWPQLFDSTVASVPGQAFRNIDLLVVDDCSPERVELDDVDGRRPDNPTRRQTEIFRGW